MQTVSLNYFIYVIMNIHLLFYTSTHNTLQMSDLDHTGLKIYLTIVTGKLNFNLEFFIEIKNYRLYCSFYRDIR